VNTQRRIIWALLASFLVQALGTGGYMAIEGWDFLDALYMTITSVTTVGFSEVRPLDTPGRWFTMCLILSGVGVILYALAAMTRMMVEGEILEVFGRKKLEKKIQAINQHYIICGYGRIGRMVAHHLLSERSIPMVIIEKNPEVIKKIEEEKLLYLQGEATDEELLIQAGIRRAKGLIAAASSDADNVYIVLSARGLNPKLFIMARAAEESSVSKLERAGADKVVSPYEIGARRMAHTILRPAVIDFIELAVHGRHMDLQIEEIRVGEGSGLQGVTIMDSGIRKKLNLIVVAIKRNSGEMLFNPTHEEPINGGDTLILLGEKKNLTELEEWLKPARS
jgi:voltage-gated potassium channel